MCLRLAGRLDNCRMVGVVVGVVYEGAATKHRNSSDIDLLCKATHFGLFALARRKEALKSMKRINIFLQTILLLLPILVLPARSQEKVGSAVETVKAFYKSHFAQGNRMYFEPQNIVF